MSSVPIVGEGEGHVPPRKHLRKLHRRIAALRELEPGVLDVWRLKPRGSNLEFVEAYDKMLEDVEALTSSLLGLDDQEES